MRRPRESYLPCAPGARKYLTDTPPDGGSIAAFPMYIIAEIHISFIHNVIQKCSRLNVTKKKLYVFIHLFVISTYHGRTHEGLEFMGFKLSPTHWSFFLRCRVFVRR